MDYDEDIYRAILDILEERPEEIVSTGLITNKLKQGDSQADIHSSKLNEPIEDLIILGEVTLVWAQQAGRLILNRSVSPGDGRQATFENGVWRCYIASGLHERYHSGLFENKKAAKEYLRQVVGDDIDELVPVPFCNNVFTTEIPGFEGYGTHTVVVRGERIHNQRSLRR